jgi:hypothetical protein
MVSVDGSGDLFIPGPPGQSQLVNFSHKIIHQSTRLSRPDFGPGAPIAGSKCDPIGTSESHFVLCCQHQWVCLVEFAVFFEG